MSGLLASLIVNYEMGMIINVREGLDLFWAGERIQVHMMIKNEHVWIEQNEALDHFAIGFDEHPSYGAWLTGLQAKQLLLDHFGGVK